MGLQRGLKLVEPANSDSVGLLAFILGDFTRLAEVPVPSK